MNAAISGIMGFALVIEGERVDIIDRDGQRHPARVDHARRMLDEPGDTAFVECEDVAQVQRLLQDAINAADALHLALTASIHSYRTTRGPLHATSSRGCSRASPPSSTSSAFYMHVRWEASMICLARALSPLRRW